VSDSASATSTHAECSACARAWRHCDATWIAHPDGGECALYADCDVPPEAHAETLACSELLGGCCP
jgi:hypothetical protein